MTAVVPVRAANPLRPFPWGALDAVSRSDVAAGRALRRWSNAFIRAGEAGAALGALLDARVSVAVGRVGDRVNASQPLDDGIGVLVGPSETGDLAHSVLLEVEPALGVALVARALRRQGPPLLGAGGGPKALAGAVAAIALAAARRAHANRALHVLDAGSALALERKLSEASGELIEASLTVIVNGEAFGARALVPRAAAQAAPVAAWNRASLAALGDVPLALPMVAAANRSTAGEVGTLRRGDAWLPATWSLRLSPGGTLEGPLLLAAPSSEEGACVALGDEGRLVVREGAFPLALTPESRDGATSQEPKARRSDRERREEKNRVSESDKDALVEAIGEVPVVVRVEVGVVEMRAREWATLVPGDVVALGSKIGDAVTLRVGGVTVARGELVDLEGEIAVRILGRANGEAPAGQARPAGKESG
jgi:type III secretion system YscQ/HrcQ family protein